VIAALINPKNPAAGGQSKDLEAAARAVGRQLLILNASSEREFDNVFATLVQNQRAPLVVASDPFFFSSRNQLVTLATTHAIPAIYEWRAFVELGGLMSYGTDLKDAMRMAAVYLGRVLKGEKPADLPVMQPTKFELVINLKTAKALGITAPQTLLVAADEVIE
jgi:ABC-type uncharacterized transport system substrate-binding protein